MLRNFLIFSAFASVFILFACYICKKRRDEAANSLNSGSQQARNQRKKLPLTEDDPNRSLLEAQQNQKALEFINTEDDEGGVEDDESPGNVADDERNPGKVHDITEETQDRKLPVTVEELEDMLK